MWVLYGKISDECVLGSTLPTFKVAEVNSMYSLVNLHLVSAITCEIMVSASPNSLFGLFMGRSLMSSYLVHLDIISMLLRSTPCISF